MTMDLDHDRPTTLLMSSSKRPGHDMEKTKAQIATDYHAISDEEDELHQNPPITSRHFAVTAANASPRINHSTGPRKGASASSHRAQSVGTDNLRDVFQRVPHIDGPDELGENKDRLHSTNATPSKTAARRKLEFESVPGAELALVTSHDLDERSAGLRLLRETGSKYVVKGVSGRLLATIDLTKCHKAERDDISRIRLLGGLSSDGIQWFFHLEFTNEAEFREFCERVTMYCTRKVFHRDE